MNLRYLLALAAVPALAAVAHAQAPVEPPPPPTPPPSAAPPVAPAPAPAPAPILEAPATPAAPAPGAAPSAPHAGDEPLAPDFSSPPAATLTDAPEAVNGVLPPEPGADAAPTFDGPVGLLHMSTAEVGGRYQLRVGLMGRMFGADSFLIEGDENLRMQGALSVGFTPVRFLEVFGSISGSANRNRRICLTGSGGSTVCNSEPGRNDPEVIKSYGDLSLGSKFAYPLSGGVSAGGELGVRFLSSVSGISFNPDATSVWLTGLTSWDLRESVRAPLRLHLDLGLYFDNSDAVQSYKGVSRPSKAVSQFAYGIAKDRVRGAFGAEGVFVTSVVQIRPFTEYHLEIVTATPDPTFADFRPPVCKPNAAPGTGTPCRDNRDQQWITLGTRALLKNNISLVVAVDLALHSVGFPYGPPLPPLEVSLGVGFPFDLAAPHYVTRTVVKERRIAEKAIEGYAAGKVLGAPTNTPVEGAIVSVAGRPKSRVATDPDGTFKTAGLPVGLVDLEVSAPGFVPASVRTSIAAGQEAPVAVTLTPKVKNGKVTGKITDPAGKALAATVHFSGPKDAEVKTDDSGAFTTTLPSGAYVIRIEADKFAGKELKLEVTDGQEQDASTSLRAKSAGPSGPSRVSVNKGKLSVRGALSFKGSGPALEVTPASAAILDELAEVLNSHPEIRRVRIEAHWDTSLPKEKAQQLTEQQAKVVAAYLSRQGVASDRLQVVGRGAEKPIVPNIGLAKMRNRRVEIRAAN
jgi:outer membrane protein OmpA-like peptidoglycan-associated protein